MKRSFFCLLFLGLLSWQRIAQEKAASEPPNSASSEPAYGEKLRIPGIHNAGKINDLLYRGGQPKQAGLAELRSEEHTSELQSHSDLVCRLLLEKKQDFGQVMPG